MGKPQTAEYMRNLGKTKGGRPKGLKNKTTITREQALLDYKEKVCRVVDQLYATQLTLAKGLNYLYKVEKKMEGKGKSAKIVKSKPTLVTDPAEMEEYLSGISAGVDIEEEGNTYFLLTSKDPNFQVIDSMLDRTFGRAIQTTDITSKGQSITFNDKQRRAIARRILNSDSRGSEETPS